MSVGAAAPESGACGSFVGATASDSSRSLMASSSRSAARSTVARMPVSPVASAGGVSSTGVFSIEWSGTGASTSASLSGAVPASTAAIAVASPVVSESGDWAGSVAPAAPVSAVRASADVGGVPESVARAASVIRVASVVCAVPVLLVMSAGAAVPASPVCDSVTDSAVPGRSSTYHSPTPIAAARNTMRSVPRLDRSVGWSVAFGTRQFLFPAGSTRIAGIRSGNHSRNPVPDSGPTGEANRS